MVQLRFRTQLPSENSDYPFRAGQIIHVDSLTEEMQAWLEAGFAEVITPEPELATIGSGERAVLPKGRRRRER